MAVQASMGYYISDIALFCIPNGDVAFVVHHLVMILAYIPTGSAPITEAALPGSGVFFQ
jgi:hypothetical protein